MGRPAERADGRDRLEPVHERRMDHVSFAHRFESGLVRRVATPIDSTPRLCDSVTLWLNTSEDLGVLGGLGGKEF